MPTIHMIESQHATGRWITFGKILNIHRMLFPEAIAQILFQKRSAQEGFLKIFPDYGMVQAHGADGLESTGSELETEQMAVSFHI